MGKRDGMIVNVTHLPVVKTTGRVIPSMEMLVRYCPNLLSLRFIKLLLAGISSSPLTVMTVVNKVSVRNKEHINDPDPHRCESGNGCRSKTDQRLPYGESGHICHQRKGFQGPPSSIG